MRCVRHDTTPRARRSSLAIEGRWSPRLRWASARLGAVSWLVVLIAACDAHLVIDDPHGSADGGLPSERGTPEVAPPDVRAPAVDADTPAPSVDAAATDAERDAPASSSDSGSSAAAPPAPCPCLDGPGTYCEASVALRAAELGCTTSARPDGDGLLACADDGTWSIARRCAAGCSSGETGAIAACELAPCDCFVRVSWCGASAGRHGLEMDPPCRVPLLPEHDGDILGCDASGRWRVLEACPMGCSEMPTGTPDACVSTRSPDDPAWPDCPHRSLLHAGLHPEASDRLRCAGVSAERISQTIGTAAASAGYHAADGTADGRSYTAAVDLRTRDLSHAEIRALLERLGTHGFAAWYRQPGADGWPASEAPHIHAVFAGVVMKSQLREQVRDYLVGRNGLSSHGRYGFWRAPASVLDTVRLLFRRHYTP